MPGLYIRAPEVSLRIFLHPAKRYFWARLSCGALSLTQQVAPILFVPPLKRACFQTGVHELAGLLTSQTLTILSAILNM